MNATKVSLNAGELTDELAGRIDLAKVQMGCRRAENFRVLRAGGITRRAGFGYVAEVATPAQKSRLEGFSFSGNAQGYILEFADEVLRVFKNGVLLAEVEETPWTSSQVFALQFAQRIDTIIVVHPDVDPHIIIRRSDVDWAVEEFPWKERVWESVDGADNMNMTAAATTGTTTITASDDIFTVAWEGTRLRLGHVRPEIPYRKSFQKPVEDATLLDLNSSNYNTGDVVYVPKAGFDRTTGRYAGLNPFGDRVYFTFIADYDFATDYAASNDPNDYPLFLDSGAVAVEPVTITGQWSFETRGTWRGIFAVERSYDEGVTWVPVKTVASARDKNFLVQDTEGVPGGALFRVVLLDMNSEDTAGGEETFTFMVFSSIIYGVARITDYLTATTVTAVVEKDFESTSATSDWYEDAFNPKNGYPKTATFHQKRLFFGGSNARPQTLWSSKTRQPYDFGFGTLAEDGLVFETDANEYEAVLWMVSHLTLLVGTSAGVWAISAPDGQYLTPENNSISRQIGFGGFEGLPAQALQNNVLFLQNKGRKVHELTGGSVEYGGYTNVDLTQLASHVTRGGVSQIATGRVPDSSLYLVAGGNLSVLTYERTQNVVGWTRWLTDGVFESIATCPGGGEDDDVYVVVLRADDRRYIERLTPDMLRVEEDSDMENLVFLDCSIVVESEDPETVVTGLDHLEGWEVEAFTDGESQGVFTVASGQITLVRAASHVLIGLPYSSFAETMPLDQGTIGRKSSLSEAVIRFRNSLGGQISQDGQRWTDIKLPQPRITDNIPLPLVSGDATMTLHSTWERTPTISVRQTAPLPMTILAMRIDGQTSK